MIDLPNIQWGRLQKRLLHLCMVGVLLLCCLPALGQMDLLGNKKQIPLSLRPLTFELGVGLSQYLGDVQSSGFGNAFAFGGSINSNFHPKWGVVGGATYAPLKGIKTLPIGQERLDGKTISIDARGVYQIFRLANMRKAKFSRTSFQSRFMLFPGFGFGAVLGSSTVFTTATSDETIARSIRRQFAPYLLISLNTRVRLTTQWSIGSEAVIKSVLSDKIDATDRAGSAGDILGFVAFKVGYTFEKNRL